MRIRIGLTTVVAGGLLAVGCHRVDPNAALLDAIAKDDVPAAQTALHLSANPNLVDRNGFTALEMSCRDEKLVQTLLDHGASVAFSPTGIPALEYAASTGSPEVIRLFLRHGSNIADRGPSGETALHAAVSAGKAQNADALLNLGADPNARDSHGNTPLLELAASPLPPIRDQIQAVVRLLLSKGANPNLKDAHGRTALDLAKSRKPRFKEFIEAIAEHQAAKPRDLQPSD